MIWPRLTTEYLYDVPDFDFDASDPGRGYLGYNNEDSEDTTLIRISHVDKAGKDRTRFFRRLARRHSGRVRVLLSGDPQWYGAFELLGSEMHLSYSLLHVRHLEHTSDWAQEGAVIFRFRP